MDSQLPQDARDLIATARRFAETEIRGRAQDWEQSGAVPASVFQAAAAAGLGAIQVPRAHGGAGQDYRAKMRVTEELSKASMAFAFAMVNTQNVAAKLAKDAPHLADAHVPDLIACRRFAATALSEPGAGSDFSNIATRATPQGEGWRLDGEKCWITNATIADLFVTYAQTDPAKGWRGIACFLVDTSRPGFHRQPALDLIGGRAIGTGGFVLDGYVVPPEHLIHPAGEAFKMAMGSINGARTYVAAMCCGMLQDALDQAIAYGRERSAFGRPLTANQGLRWLLADIATELEAARLLTYKAADLVAADAPEAVLAAAHAKKYAARIAQARLPDCIQAMGAHGLKREHGLGPQLACAKIAHYVDGSSEIQNERIAAILID